MTVCVYDYWTLDSVSDFRYLEKRYIKLKVIIDYVNFKKQCQQQNVELEACVTAVPKPMVCSPSNTFGMNWKTHCEPDNIFQKSKMDFTSAFAAFPPTFGGKLPRRVVAVIPAH